MADSFSGSFRDEGRPRSRLLGREWCGLSLQRIETRGALPPVRRRPGLEVNPPRERGPRGHRTISRNGLASPVGWSLASAPPGATALPSATIPARSCDRQGKPGARSCKTPCRVGVVALPGAGDGKPLPSPAGGPLAPISGGRGTSCRKCPSCAWPVRVREKCLRRDNSNLRAWWGVGWRVRLSASVCSCVPDRYRMAETRSFAWLRERKRVEPERRPAPLKLSVLNQVARSLVEKYPGLMQRPCDLGG